MGIDLDERDRRPRSVALPGGRSSAGRRTASCPFDDGAFDLVVSLRDDRARPRSGAASWTSSAGCSRQDGLLLISTPNKHQYLVENEFHEREFLHEEFVELLRGALSPASRSCCSTTGLPRLCCRRRWPATTPARAAEQTRLRKARRASSRAASSTRWRCADTASCPSVRAASWSPRLWTRLTSSRDDWWRRSRRAEKWHAEYQTAKRSPQMHASTSRPSDPVGRLRLGLVANDVAAAAARRVA